MENSTTNEMVCSPLLDNNPTPNIQPDHCTTPASNHNSLGIPRVFSTELQIQTWKEAFAEWKSTQQRIRLLVPADPFTCNKVICNKLGELPSGHPNYLSKLSGCRSEPCPLLSQLWGTGNSFEGVRWISGRSCMLSDILRQLFSSGGWKRAREW